MKLRRAFAVWMVRIIEGIALGVLGAFAAGIFIGVFGELVGAGEVHVGRSYRWDSIIGEAAMYGVPVGLLFVPPAYLYLWHAKVNLRSAGLLLFVGAVAGGIVGMTVAPIAAYLGAILGFFVASAVMFHPRIRPLLGD